MSYFCPLTIFNEDQLEKVYAGDIYGVKKEILLHFQFESNSTIRIGSRELDKNGVLELFADLEKDLALHTVIFQNPNIRKYLESEDLSLFNSQPLYGINPSDPSYNQIVTCLLYTSPSPRDS